MGTWKNYRESLYPDFLVRTVSLGSKLKGERKYLSKVFQLINKEETI